MSLFLQNLARIRSQAVQVNLTLTIPGEPLSLPLAADPSLSVTVSPPIAHWGPGPVQVRLISHTLRQGQVRHHSRGLLLLMCESVSLEAIRALFISAG